MRTVLAIAGCGPRLEIALTAPGQPAPALVAASGPTPRSDLIVAAIDVILRAAGIEVETIEAVVASTGPGSFTGIRVALATAAGIASAHGTPRHGFSSLLAQATRTTARPCLAIQPARRGHVWTQLFESGLQTPETVAPPVLVATIDLALATVPIVAPAGIDLPQAVERAPTSMTTAEALLTLAAAETRLDPATLVPSYLEDPLTEPSSPPSPPWLRSPRAS